MDHWESEFVFNYRSVKLLAHLLYNTQTLRFTYKVIQRLERVVTRDLNGEERALISLFYNEDKSVGELASILNLTPVNVKVKLHRIRKKIYVLMKKEEEENNGK